MSAKVMDRWLKALFAFGITRVCDKWWWADAPPTVYEIEVLGRIVGMRRFKMRWSRGESRIYGYVSWVGMLRGEVASATIDFIPSDSRSEELFRRHFDQHLSLTQEQAKEAGKFLET